MKESHESSFGEELRRSREVREVSLESIAAATKISVRYLTALEKGDYSRLPAPVFTRGFIRAYAGYLGLDPDEMVNGYLSEVGVVSGRPAETVAEPRRKAPRPASRVSLAVGSLLAVIAVLTVIGIWKIRPRSRGVPRRTPAAQQPAIPPNIREVRAPSGPAAGISAPSTAVDPNAGVSLGLLLEADCWMELFGDGRLIFSGLLRKGESRHFETRHDFRLTLGNARAAKITVNGRAIAPLGAAGEVVRDFRIDSEHLAELVSRRS
jgi:transcriptional regulator with XRE-family HTH domain